MIQADFDEKLAASQRQLEDAQAARNHAVKRSGTLAKDLGTVLFCVISTLRAHTFPGNYAQMHANTLCEPVIFVLCPCKSARRMRVVRDSHIMEREALKAQLEGMQQEVERKNRSLRAAMEALDSADNYNVR
jgi:hypothetical protein